MVRIDPLNILTTTTKMAALVRNSRQFINLFPNIGSTAQPTCLIAVRTNCYRASITRTKRKAYTRTYPVKLVQPDGSSFTIRFNEPRRILIMPENLALLTLEEKEDRYRKMDPPKRVKIEEYHDDDFDRSKYLQRMKKRK